MRHNCLKKDIIIKEIYQEAERGGDQKWLNIVTEWTETTLYKSTDSNGKQNRVEKDDPWCG